MQYRGNLSVLTALARGEDVTVIVLGGGLSCVVSLGVLVSFVLARIFTPKAVVGFSGGACNGAAAITNPEKIEQVIDVYRHIAYGGFLTMKYTWWGMPYLAFDLEELLATLKGEREHRGLPRLDHDRVPANRFFVGVTEHETGRGHVFPAHDNLFTWLEASMSIQGARKPVAIGGVNFSDGAVGGKIGMSIRKVWARRVIVLMNRVPPEERWWFEKTFTPMITRAMLWGEPHELREAAVRMDDDLAIEMSRLGACERIQSLFIAPDLTDPYLLPQTAVPFMLELGYERGKQFGEKLVEMAHAC